MERSGWFDDDDDESASSSPASPPSEGGADGPVWRHPSELGRFGSYGPSAQRRRNAVRFAGALALGSAGTLVFVALASMHVFGTEGADRRGPLELAEGSLLSVTAPSLATAPTIGRTNASAPTTAKRATASTRPVSGAGGAPAGATTIAMRKPSASMPPQIGVRVGGSDQTIPAVIDEDGWLIVRTDELNGATRADAVLDGGRLVGLEIDSVDERAGVARLRPAERIVAPANQIMAWLGVTGEDVSPAVDAAATTSPSTVGDRTDGTGAGRDTRLVSTAPVVSTTGATAPAGTTAGTTGAATEAASTVATTIASSLARATSTSVPAATTSTGSTSTGSTSTGSTSTGSTATSVEPTTAGPARSTAVSSTAPDSLQDAGVRVQRVHDGSPAAAAGLRPGDVIVAVDGRVTRSVWALVLAVRHHAIGSTVQVTVVRDAHEMPVDVLLAVGPTG